MKRSKRPLVQLICAGLIGSVLAVSCSAGPRYLPLTEADPVAVLAEGLSVSANPAQLPPDFEVALSAAPAETFLAGEAGDEWAAPLQALPSGLGLRSAVFKLQTQGTLPPQLFVSVAAPAGVDESNLDLYAWDGQAWRFLPAQHGRPLTRPHFRSPPDFPYQPEGET